MTHFFSRLAQHIVQPVISIRPDPAPAYKSLEAITHVNHSEAIPQRTFYSSELRQKSSAPIEPDSRAMPEQFSDFAVCNEVNKASFDGSEPQQNKQSNLRQKSSTLIEPDSQLVPEQLFDFTVSNEIHKPYHQLKLNRVKNWFNNGFKSKAEVVKRSVEEELPSVNTSKASVFDQYIDTAPKQTNQAKIRQGVLSGSNTVAASVAAPINAIEIGAALLTIEGVKQDEGDRNLATSTTTQSHTVKSVETLSDKSPVSSTVTRTLITKSAENMDDKKIKSGLNLSTLPLRTESLTMIETPAISSKRVARDNAMMEAKGSMAEKNPKTEIDIKWPKSGAATHKTSDDFTEAILAKLNIASGQNTTNGPIRKVKAPITAQKIESKVLLVQNKPFDIEMPSVVNQAMLSKGAAAVEVSIVQNPTLGETLAERNMPLTLNVKQPLVTVEHNSAAFNQIQPRPLPLSPTSTMSRQQSSKYQPIKVTIAKIQVTTKPARVNKPKFRQQSVSVSSLRDYLHQGDEQ